MRTLIVTLPPPGESASPSVEYEYVLSTDGLQVGSTASAAAALLPQPTGAGAEVVAVVPARALSWHQVDLPKGTSAASPRLRAVLEGLLEDRLLDEPGDLHFALQPQAKPGAPVWVAACNRAWLRTAVQALEAAQRPVSRIVPELWPGEPAALYVTGEPGRATMTLADDSGVVIWPVAGELHAGVPALPDTVAVLAEPAVAGVAEQALQRPVMLQQAPQRHLLAAQSPWDLAQFDLASSGRSRAFKKFSTGWAGLLQAPQWRAARWGLVALVLANLVGLNAWAWMERSALKAKREQIRTALTGTFPSVRVVVDAPVQMEREVAALRQATGAASGRDLESMLAALAAAAPPGLAPTSIEFTGNELRLKGPGAAPAAQHAGPSLQAFGYRAASEGDTLVVRQGVAP
jgi:general secretion pathway protein L